jgi:hypothetical protein
MKFVAHCAVWVLAFCAVLVSPVILIFAVPLAIGIGSDIVTTGAGPIAAIVLAGTLACLTLGKSSVRAYAKTLFPSSTPLGTAKRLADGAAGRHAAKSIG